MPPEEFLKCYLYISDAKLDMLYAQIELPRRNNLVSELKLDLKIVSLSLRENPQEDTRYGKLQAVSSYLAS